MKFWLIAWASSLYEQTHDSSNIETKVRVLDQTETLEGHVN